MKTNIFKVGMLACAATLLLGSCYDDLLTFNEENNATGTGTGENASFLASAEDIQGYLREAEERLIDDREHKYQYQLAMHIDDFAGYMALPHNFEGRIASSFAFNNDFASGPYANFQWVAQQVVPVLNTQEKLPAYKPLYAFAKLMFAQSAYNVLVVHGPVPFDDYRELKESHPLTYNKQSETFTKILEYIDDAIKDLKDYQADPSSEVDTYIEGTDLVTKKTAAEDIVVAWLKYANSMKLRIALNLIKVDGYTFNGQTMQQMAEAAVSDGVFTENDYGIGLTCGIDQTWGVHPLFKISKNWVDSRLHASYHNFLVRTKSKLLGYFFSKNTGDLYNNRKKLVAQNGTEYMSMRSGTYLRDKSNDQDYILYSRLGDNMQFEPLFWMKPEEVLFLQAEAALRGWNMGGTPEEFYNKGVLKSLTNHGFSQTDYDEYMSWQGVGSIDKNSDTYKQYTYTDFYDSDNNLAEWDGYFTLNNAWGAIDTNPSTSSSDPEMAKEIQLEKIITQKWIAMYPLSQLAWTDYRRTGYPRLLPAVADAYKDADGSVDETTYIRRLPYSIGTEEAMRQEIESYATPVLDEEASGATRGNKQGTRLWWDVEGKNNF